jgi:hypothetical protein
MTVGVEIITDLQDLYTDVGMLTDLKNKISPIEFKRFLKAASQTTVLSHVIIPAPYGESPPTPPISSYMSSTLKSELPPSPPSPPTSSTAAKLAEEERKLLERLSAAKKSEETAANARIEKLRKEVEAAELAERTALKSRMEEERRHTEMLRKTKERKTLIDSKFYSANINLYINLYLLLC